ncbi:unnamed protein product [Rhizophagus irregularis]|nr:unnamed protein product [Rhizophagus irregularis]
MFRIEVEIPNFGFAIFDLSPILFLYHTPCNFSLTISLSPAQTIGSKIFGENLHYPYQSRSDPPPNFIFVSFQYHDLWH